MTKYCSSCHTANPDRARRCRGCGGRFSGIRTPAFGFDSTRLGAAESVWIPSRRHEPPPKPPTHEEAPGAGKPRTRRSTPVAAVAAKLAVLAALAGAAVLVAQVVPADRWGQAMARWVEPAVRAPAGQAARATPPSAAEAPATSAAAVLDALGIDPARIAGPPPVDAPAIGPVDPDAASRSR